VITFVVAVVSDNTGNAETFAIFNLFAILFLLIIIVDVLGHTFGGNNTA
jgi:hypothetical protein